LDKFTGQLKFYTNFNTTDYMNSVKVKEDDMFLLSKNRLYKLSLQNAKVIDEKIIDAGKFGDIKYFGDASKIYVSKNNIGFESLSQADSSSLYLVNDKNDVLKMNQNLQSLTLIPYDSLYFFHRSNKDYTFLNKEEKTFVINNLSENIGILNVSNLNFSGINFFLFMNEH